jgi:6-pyruvoyltetrahydropterin/6-carboxytetrahydropterin synthase
MTYLISIKHNFETAHRLPQLRGKCASLHGHSWWARVVVESERLATGGIVLEFGPFKKALRSWIDEYLDHATMLGTDDPLIDPLIENGCKIFLFDTWPTVENVAALIGYRAQLIVAASSQESPLRVRSCTVIETHVNSATWEPSL